MGGITCNAEGFAGETGAVDVLEGGERDTNDLLSCSHYPLKGLAAGRVAGAIPHSDAASKDALDGASVEGAHDGGRGSGSSEFAEEVETLLCFLGQCCSVFGPGEVLCDVYTQELGAAHSLHGHTIDGQRRIKRESILSLCEPRTLFKGFKGAVCRILTLLKHTNTIICLQIFKKHVKLTYLFI